MNDLCSIKALAIYDSAYLSSHRDEHISLSLCAECIDPAGAAGSSFNEVGGHHAPRGWLEFSKSGWIDARGRKPMEKPIDHSNRRVPDKFTKLGIDYHLLSCSINQDSIKYPRNVVER